MFKAANHSWQDIYVQKCIAIKLFISFVQLVFVKE